MKALDSLTKQYASEVRRHRRSKASISIRRGIEIELLRNRTEEIVLNETIIR